MHVTFRQLRQEPDNSNELTRPSLQFVPLTSKLSPVLLHRLLPRVASLGWCRILSPRHVCILLLGYEICQCSQFPTDSKVWILYHPETFLKENILRHRVSIEICYFLSKLLGFEAKSQYCLAMDHLASSIANASVEYAFPGGCCALMN